MILSEANRNQLTRLEESLWIVETRYDRAYMEYVLHPDFIEFGCSGRRYIRDEILDFTGNTIDVKLPFDEFSIRKLSDTVVHIIYISEVQYPDNLQICNRISIWVHLDGHWQLYFHQGTPTTH